MRRAFIQTKDGWFSCVFDGDKKIIIGDKIAKEHQGETRSCDYGFALYKDKNQVLVVKNRHEANAGNTYDVKVEGNIIWLL